MPPINHGRAEDPSGIAVQTRARDRRIQMFQDHMGDNYDVMTQASAGHGPLPDPLWDGYFQAVEEAKPDPNMRSRFGYATQEKADTSRDPVHAAQTLDPNIGGMKALNSPSSQLGTAIDGLARYPVNTTSPFDRLQYQMEALGGNNPFAVTPTDPNDDAQTGFRRPEDPVARFKRLNSNPNKLGPK